MKSLFDLTDILPNAIIMETLQLKDVQANNRLIAEYMEYTNNYWYMNGELSYHENWAMLMPVVEKINDHPKTSYPTINIDHDQIFLHFGNSIEMMDFTKREYGSWIGAVYAAVVSYVKWYNANK